MITMMRILGGTVALVIACVSVAMTFSFGLAFSDGADRYIYAALFGAMDVAKFTLPTLAAGLAISGAISSSKKARWCYLFFAILSAASHAGLTISASDAAKTAQSNVAELQQAYDSKKMALDALGMIRSSGKIEADIGNAERNPIFTDEKRSNRCVNDTAQGSVEFCKSYRLLLAERSDRADFDRLTGEVRTAKADLDKARSGGGAKANALAKTLAGKTISEDTAMIIIVLFMVIGIEIGSSLMMEFAAAAGIKPRKIEEPVPTTPLIAQDDADTRVSEAEIVPDDRAEMCPKEWVAGRMEPHRKTNTPWDAAYALYKAEAEDQGMKAASDNSFSRALTHHGYDRKRPGGVTTVMGARVRMIETTNLKIVK